MFGEGEFGRNEVTPRCDGAYLDLFHSRSPPSVKGKTVEGLQDSLLTVDLGEAGSAVDLGALLNIMSTPPPPPSVKRRMVEGVRNLLWTIRLHAGGMVVDLSAHLKHIFRPPPPPHH
jgi:hypothetical protein